MVRKKHCSAFVGSALVKLGLLALAGCTSSYDGSSNFDRPQATAALQSMRDLGPGNSDCREENESVVYVGEITYALVDCLQQRSLEANKLVITSNGGDVVAAMAAARIMSDNELELEVEGLCASSCGNYLVPGARAVRVQPYSAIILHGAPNQSEMEIRETIQAALIAAGLPEERITSEMIDQQVENLLRQVEQHNEFAAEFEVCDAWYVPEINTLAQKHDVETCVPTTELQSFWEPQSKAEEKRLAELLDLEFMIGIPGWSP